jgi:hypothetical protein
MCREEAQGLSALRPEPAAMGVPLVGITYQSEDMSEFAPYLGARPQNVQITSVQCHKSILSPGQGWHRRANAQKRYKSPPNGQPIN